MNGFIKEREGIYRLKVQYTTVYTSIFLLETEQGDLLVDTASYNEDIDSCLLPALREMNKSLSELYAVVITHDHFDHSGGLKRILEHAPNIKVITEICEISKGIFIYPMAGHTEDSIGVFDSRTNTLISGDGLQGAGVDKYTTSVPFKEEYIKTLDSIINDERIENILFSHAYEPWFEDKILGRDKVIAAVIECKKYI